MVVNRLQRLHFQKHIKFIHIFHTAFLNLIRCEINNPSFQCLPPPKIKLPSWPVKWQHEGFVPCRGSFSAGSAAQLLLQPDFAHLLGSHLPHCCPHWLPRTTKDSYPATDGHGPCPRPSSPPGRGGGGTRGRAAPALHHPGQGHPTTQ